MVKSKSFWALMAVVGLSPMWGCNEPRPQPVGRAGQLVTTPGLVPGATAVVLGHVSNQPGSTNVASKAALSFEVIPAVEGVTPVPDLADLAARASFVGA